jgi:hypothetical protein
MSLKKMDPCIFSHPFYYLEALFRNHLLILAFAVVTLLDESSANDP